MMHKKKYTEIKKVWNKKKINKKKLSDPLSDKKIDNYFNIQSYYDNPVAFSAFHATKSLKFAKFHFIMCW